MPMHVSACLTSSALDKTTEISRLNANCFCFVSYDSLRPSQHFSVTLKRVFCVEPVLSR